MVYKSQKNHVKYFDVIVIVRRPFSITVSPRRDHVVDHLVFNNSTLEMHL